MRLFLAAALVCGLTTGASAQNVAKADPAKVEQIVKTMFAKAGPEWASVITPDETIMTCTQTGNAPSTKQYDEILAREKKTVVMPADGNVMGDWKKGETVAQRGTGGQFTDRPDTYRGGNCYACHQLALSEVSFGTLGPSLLGYGKARKFAPEEAKATFAKIYNPHSVLACSQMPRFGYSGFLSEEQIKDVVAYLFDPESPVNK